MNIKLLKKDIKIEKDLMEINIDGLISSTFLRNKK